MSATLRKTDEQSFSEGIFWEVCQRESGSWERAEAIHGQGCDGKEWAAPCRCLHAALPDDEGGQAETDEEWRRESVREALLTTTAEGKGLLR